MIGAYRGQWVRPPLESAQPHEIVDAFGQSVDLVESSLSRTILNVYANRGAATRHLNYMIKAYDKRRRGDSDDPRNWTVRPVKERA